MRISQIFLMISLVASTVVCSASSYDEVMAGFKLNLYHRQQGLMEYENYDFFIEPYLKEAEDTLLASKYVMENPNSKLSSRYLGCLLSYNVLYFRNYAISQSIILKFSRSVQKNSKKALAKAYGNLIEVVKEIEHMDIVANLNSDEEIKKTAQLIKKVNSDYYKELGIGFKFIFPLVMLRS